MLPFIKDKKNCTGCTACFSACPKKCITMKEDDEGFLYPSASDECVHCRICEKVCPQINSVDGVSERDFKQKAYAGITHDKAIWERSASGGAFSEICSAWGDDNTMFVGAAWDGLRVKHQCVIGVNNIAILCKSKYIASEVGVTFSKIREQLEQGKKALFCGTPCQVAGLKSFLKKEYPDLLLVDLICHGVGSPKVFSHCIDILSEEFGKRIEHYEFRAKKSVYESDHIQKIKSSDSRYIYLENDPYIQLFLKQDCLREACGKNCKYRNEHRMGDITIADYKGLQTVFPELIGIKQNYSSIIINTSKGASIIPTLERNMELLECEVSDIKAHNPLFYRNTWTSESRDSFFEEFIKSPKNTILNRTSPAKVHKISLKKKIYNAMPTIVRKWIIVIYGKIRGGVI